MLTIEFSLCMASVTQLLGAICAGDRQASAALLPLVYHELRRLAAQRMARERPGHTLDATALVHEAYLRLVDSKDQPGWDSRAHFFAAAAEAMRRILVENARRKRRLKHGAAMERQECDEQQIAAPQIDLDLLDLDAALDKLQQQDPRKAALVKLRYFAGLSQEEAAQALRISVSTADRDWAYARAWLLREMQSGGA